MAPSVLQLQVLLFGNCTLLPSNSSVIKKDPPIVQNEQYTYYT